MTPPRPLPREFFDRSARRLAPALLGTWLCRRRAGETLRGRIVEVEAYTDDAASHARGRRRTARNAPMFGPAGHAYVYFTYGMHHCMNVVAGPDGEPGAVLIRGLDVVPGAAGPGRLCKVLAIDRTLDGIDLTHGDLLWIEAGRRRAGERIVRCPRVGIRLATDLPWRFYLAGNPGVSRRDRAAEALATAAARDTLRLPAITAERVDERR